MMKWKDYLILILVSVILLAVISIFQQSPGYMDADYYLSGGMQLANGNGFQDAIIWNYLDKPFEIPHPSHGYWMPLASILAALGIKTVQSINVFKSAQIPFILIASVVPPMTAYIANSYGLKREQVLFAGFLSIFSGFYLPFMTTTDTFGVFMVLGGGFFIIIDRLSNEVTGGSRNRLLLVFLLGLLTGLMHLSRTDGIIWFFLAVIFLKRPRYILFLSVGYLIVMGPWFYRNIFSFGTILAPGGYQVLWLLEYDEIYAFPTEILTLERWLNSGLDAILMTRLKSSGFNLLSTFSVQGIIFLAPLMILGLWRLRRKKIIKGTVLAWIVTFLLMSVIFPLPGMRGGFFHSASGVQLIFWSVVPEGLDVCLAWGEKLRGWNVQMARRVFSVGIIVIAIFASGSILFMRMIGESYHEPAWSESHRNYKDLEDALLAIGAHSSEVVMVNNPPGYFVASQRPAVVIPHRDLDDILAVAEKFDVKYLLLEPTQGQDELYTHPEGWQGLKYLQSVNETHIFVFQ